MSELCDWTKITIEGEHRDLDTISSVVSMVDNGLLIEDYSDLSTDGMYGALIDDKLLNADKNKISVSIFIPKEKNLMDGISFIRDHLNSLSIPFTLKTEGLKEEDWAESWKQYYKPIHLGRVTIVPAWEKYAQHENEVVITMDPGMAFGTGTHETTRLVLSLLDETIKGGEKVLDVGTGSGILAIAASKLGALSCRAYDIDPVAVKVAKDNIQVNQCSNIECGISDLLLGVDTSNGLFDVCVANIVAEIIIRMAKDIGGVIKLGGKLIVSGIVISKKVDVETALCTYGFKIIKEQIENDWIAILFERIK